MAAILIIDDYSALGETWAEVLRSFGHTVRDSPGAKAGAEVVQGPGIGLVISDIAMPDHDGLEVAMAAQEKTPAAAGDSGAGDFSRHVSIDLSVGRKLGAVRTFLKSFSIPSEFATANEALDGGQPSQ